MTILKRYHPMTAARVEHLELIRELAASEKKSRLHCPAGHPYTGANLYVRPDGRRMCRACRRNQARLLSARARARKATA